MIGSLARHLLLNLLLVDHLVLLKRLHFRELLVCWHLI